MDTNKKKSKKMLMYKVGFLECFFSNINDERLNVYKTVRVI